MTDEHKPVDSSERPVWEIISLEDFQLPSSPVPESAGNTLSALLRLFRRKGVNEKNSQLLDNLQKPTAGQLSQVLGRIDWNPAVQALTNKLGDWLQQDPKEGIPVRFLVGPPFSCVDKLLRCWAFRNNWTIYPGINRESLLTSTEMREMDSLTGRWVIPDLEHYFLRHARGLDLLRQLFEQVDKGRSGCGIIACDSWAWSFLQHVWPVSSSEILTLQAIDGERLHAILKHEAMQQNQPVWTIRDADSRQNLLSTVTDSNSFLKSVAATARGNLGVCLDRLRNHLYVSKAEPLADIGLKSKQAAAETELWWSPSAYYPELPSDSGEDVALILHALLLHNGLSYSMMTQLLPLNNHHIAVLLNRLVGLDLIHQYNDIWRVSAAGYGAVRDFIAANAYWTDRF